MLSKADQKKVDEAIEIIEKNLTKKDLALDSSHTVKNYCCLQLQGLEREVFSVLFLDSQHRLIKYEELFKGTINAASVWSREVVKAALKYNCAAVILCHNHPSNDPTPSQSDEILTKRLIGALELVDVRVLDHIVVGGVETFSFAERGLL